MKKDRSWVCGVSAILVEQESRLNLVHLVHEALLITIGPPLGPVMYVLFEFRIISIWH